MNKRFWVEVRVSYDGVTEKGEKTNMKETWLVRAATFAEAESRATEKVCAYNGVEDVCVEACVKRNIAVFWVSSLNGDKFYKVRCEGLLVNEKTGKERIVKRDYLVLSPNMLDAYETFVKCMSDSDFSEFEVLGINLTPIVEVLSDHE
jgi:hypothetical protein|nr:MAG TPA: protein of unknown function (DUF4494) [Caudoviricetes sp.]